MRESAAGIEWLSLHLYRERPGFLRPLSFTQRPASYAGLLAKFSRQDNRPPPGPPPASLPGILFGPGDSRDVGSKPIAALTDDCIHWIFSMLLKS